MLYLIGSILITCPVADLSLMLALMAGRNGAETTSLVRNGEVHIVSPSRVLTQDLCLYSGRTALGHHLASAARS